MNGKRVTLLAIAIGIAACANNNRPAINTPFAEVAVSNHVEERIEADARMEGARIRATTDAGVVTLAGTVDSADDVILAGHIASSTPGVQAVLNELRVHDVREAPENAAVYDEGIREPDLE